MSERHFFEKLLEETLNSWDHEEAAESFSLESENFHLQDISVKKILEDGGLEVFPCIYNEDSQCFSVKLGSHECHIPRHWSFFQHIYTYWLQAQHDPWIWNCAYGDAEREFVNVFKGIYQDLRRILIVHEDQKLYFILDRA